MKVYEKFFELFNSEKDEVKFKIKMLKKKIDMN